METLKQLVAEQHKNLAELSLEFQRKEVTPARVVRLMRLVTRNVEIIDRVTRLLESMDARLAKLEAGQGVSHPEPHDM